MNTTVTAVVPRWSTSSFGGSSDLSGTESSALRDHLSVCSGQRGRWFTLRCAAEAMNGFVSGRFVTTLVMATLLIGASALFA